MRNSATLICIATIYLITALGLNCADILHVLSKELTRRYPDTMLKYYDLLHFISAELQ